MTLPPLDHKNDLPPKWDGHPVEWEGWEPPPPVQICGRGYQPQPCPACGRFSEQAMNHGRATRTDILRIRPGIRSQFRLVAFRCTHCATDQVYEINSHDLYTLDYTDYGDEGSNA